MLDMDVYNLLSMKRFQGIWAGNVQECSLNSRIGKASYIVYLQRHLYNHCFSHTRVYGRVKKPLSLPVLATTNPQYSMVDFRPSPRVTVVRVIMSSVQNFADAIGKPFRPLGAQEREKHTALRLYICCSAYPFHRYSQAMHSPCSAPFRAVDSHNPSTTATPQDGRVCLVAMRVEMPAPRLRVYHRGRLSRRGSRGLAALTVSARPLRSLPLSP